jgi:four helix bundle suffix protein
VSGLLAPRGDFKRLLTYQKAEVLYDLTFRFAHAHLAKGDRTVDQMVQAARSGKQNIAEASAAAATSAETEIKLTNVAKASLVELRIDYEDYLRVRGLRLWEKDSKEALYMRDKSRDASTTSAWYLEIAKTRPAETTANVCLCLLHQADYLLQRQLEALEQKFLEQGGFKEKMYAARLQARAKASQPGPPRSPSLPSTPSRKPSP